MKNPYALGYNDLATGHASFAVGKAVTVIQGNGLLLETTYLFNELGQIIG